MFVWIKITQLKRCCGYVRIKIIKRKMAMKWEKSELEWWIARVVTRVQYIALSYYTFIQVSCVKWPYVEKVNCHKPCFNRTHDFNVLYTRFGAPSSLSHILSPSLTHSQTHTHTLSHTHILFLTFFLSLFLSHTHIHTRIHSVSEQIIINPAINVAHTDPMPETDHIRILDN